MSQVFSDLSGFAPRGGRLPRECRAAARESFWRPREAAGYDVSGTELDGDVRRFAKDQTGLYYIFPGWPGPLVEKQHPDKSFEEVAAGQALGNIRRHLRPCFGGDQTLRAGEGVHRPASAPNRERWLTGPDVLDYPPNHFLLWNVKALKKLSDSSHGFEI